MGKHCFNPPFGGEGFKSEEIGSTYVVETKGFNPPFGGEGFKTATVTTLLLRTSIVSIHLSAEKGLSWYEFHFTEKDLKSFNPPFGGEGFKAMGATGFAFIPALRFNPPFGGEGFKTIATIGAKHQRKRFNPPFGGEGFKK